MSELVEKIINTSIREFKEHGYDKVTVDAICTKSGIAKNTFYYHFKSKDEVLAAYYEMQIKVNIGTTIELMKLPSSHDKLWYLYTVILKVSENLGPDIYKNVIAWGMKNGRTFLSASTEGGHPNGSMQLVLEIIRQGQQSGELRRSHPAEMLLWSFNNALLGSRVHWCSQKGNINETEQLKDLFDLIFLP